MTIIDHLQDKELSTCICQCTVCTQLFKNTKHSYLQSALEIVILSKTLMIYKHAVNYYIAILTKALMTYIVTL